MTKVEIGKAKDGLYVTTCGRVFKELAYVKYCASKLREKYYLEVRYGGKRYPVHKLVAETFLTKPPVKSMVLHYDDNPTNNHVSNLRWGSAKENNEDYIRNRLLIVGKKGRSWTVSKTNIRHKQIVECVRDGFKYKEISEIFNISESRVSQIVSSYKENGLVVRKTKKYPNG